MPHERAVDLIVNGEGTHFDPAIIDAFRRTAPLLYRVAHETNDTAFASIARRVHPRSAIHRPDRHRLHAKITAGLDCDRIQLVETFLE